MEKVIPIKDGISAFEQEVRDADRGGNLTDLIINADEFIKMKFPEKTYLLGHIIAERHIIIIPGWRGTGKTWFALSLANAITCGQSLGPWASGEPVPVLYVDGELTESDLQERVQFLNPKQERRCPLYIYNDCLTSETGYKRACLLDTSWQNDLKETALALGVKMIFFDNISSLSPGIDENSKKEWDPVNQFLLNLRFAGVGSVLLHHTGKGGSQRGTSAREDNNDTTIYLNQPSGYTPDMGCEFIVSFGKNRVKTTYHSELKAVRFKLTTDDTGSGSWSWVLDKTATRDEIVSLLQEGLPNKEIAVTCGVTPGYVSRVKKDLSGR
jgi:putative DNA primase/helicase